MLLLEPPSNDPGKRHLVRFETMPGDSFGRVRCFAYLNKRQLIGLLAGRVGRFRMSSQLVRDHFD